MEQFTFLWFKSPDEQTGRAFLNYEIGCVLTLACALRAGNFITLKHIYALTAEYGVLICGS